MGIRTSVAVGGLIAACTLAFAADWPTWRHDARRTAASPAALPATLHAQWERELPAPRPAYPLDLRLGFDRCAQPVAAGTTLFVPSAATDSVTALDTETGAPKWVFFADGPVRFAPAVWRDHVYFVSDDGHLTCLDATDGALRWRVSGAPEDRAGPLLLGNGRLISRWPARGGPVVADGTAYFAAGVWPFEGVFVCAVDAATGKVLWRSESGAFIENGLIDHGARRDAGLSPQGYLTRAAGRLIVPSGRALPAFLDAATGRMEPYTTGWGGRVALAKGCWYAAAIGPYLYQSGDLYALSAEAVPDASRPGDLLTPKQFARAAGLPLERVRQWIEQGRLRTVPRHGQPMVRARKPSKTTYVSLWMGRGMPGEQHAVKAHPRLQIDRANHAELGVFREPVLTNTAIYYSRPVRGHRGRGGHWPQDVAYGPVVAEDTTSPRWGITCQGNIDGTQALLPWHTVAFEESWTLPAELRVHIKAGPRLYAGREGQVAAIDIPSPGGKPAVGWTAEVQGTPATMLAADGKLFVVTDKGTLTCFGAREGTPTTYPKPGPPRPADPPWAERAAALLQHTGITEGYAVALGVGSGELVQALAQRSRLHLIVLEADRGRVQAARRRFHAAGLYGTRVHVLPGSLDSVELSPYLASLAVAEEGGAEASPAALFALLRPYGGAACLRLSDGEHDAFAERVAKAELPGATLQRAGEWAVLRRTGGPPGADDWTHESGSAANTFASEDESVRPPFGVLWFGGEADTLFPSWDYTHSRPPLPLVAGGRLFFLVARRVHAVDIYTGRHLWTTELPTSAKTKSRRKNHMIWQRDTARNFLAAAGRLYVILEGACLTVDPATGKKTSVLRIPKRFAPTDEAVWDEVRAGRDCLVATTGKHLLCLDPGDGAVRWSAKAERDRFAFALGGGKVFCVDYASLARARRAAAPPREARLVAHDLASGRLVWDASAQIPPDTADEKTRQRFAPLEPSLAYCGATDILLLTATRAIAAAYRGRDGHRLWAKRIPCRNPPSHWSGPEPPILLPQTLITHAGELYDPHTGERQPRRLWLGMNRAYNSGGTRGCGRALANRHIVTLRDADAAFLDIATGRQTFLRGVRSGCSNSLLPAGGVLNAPNFAHGCACNWPVFTSFALVHMPQAAQWRRGPASKPKVD